MKMTVEELKVYLKKKNVPKDSYNINNDGTPKDFGAVVLISGPKKYYVYATERNEDYCKKEFTSESDAVDYFLKLMAIN